MEDGRLFSTLAHAQQSNRTQAKEQGVRRKDREISQSHVKMVDVVGDQASYARTDDTRARTRQVRNAQVASCFSRGDEVRAKRPVGGHEQAGGDTDNRPRNVYNCQVRNPYGDQQENIPCCCHDPT